MLLPISQIAKSNFEPALEACFRCFGRLKPMTVLVTGGAGYIGSHVVRLLQERGQKVVVLDDMSEGIRTRIGNAPLIQIDLASPEAVSKLTDVFQVEKVRAVVHLAARKKVGESVERPDWYHQQNVGGLQNLLSAMEQANVRRLVFSSSAATYGVPDVDQVSEDFNCQPINPYGKTKLDGEHLVQAAARDWGLREVSLRYFNVAGTGWDDLVDTQVANIVPIVFKSLAEGKSPKIFGNDWPTPDGTCVRDYVHVLDLAEAHLVALDYLETDDRKHDVFNVGTGEGSSVLDVINTVAEVTGKNIVPDIEARRSGDPAYLCADVSRIKETLGWEATHNLHDIIASVWKAHQR
jgi:UDP-glucose 4-epimerase